MKSRDKVKIIKARKEERKKEKECLNRQSKCSKICKLREKI